ncbi:hypothetical protein ACFL20_06485 [Spirochaetota bacterium]
MKTRVVSALRDDIEKLFLKLSTNYNKKLKLLDDLFLKEVDNRYYLKTDNIDKINKSILITDEIIEKLNVCDFEISSTIDKICNKSGIDHEQFNRLINSENDSVILEVRNAQNSVADKISELNENRENLLMLMKEKSDSVQKKIKELVITRKLKNNKPQL